MRGTYIGEGKMLISPIWGGRLIVPSNDLSLAPDLIIDGVLESPLTRFFAKNVKKGDCVIDVGANIGYFSVLLGHLVGSQGKVYSFEANKYMYEYLLDNLSINYLHDRCETFNLAVYSEDTHIPFYVSKKYMGNSSIHPPSSEYKKHYKENIEKIEIATIVLDEFFQSQKKIDYLKIDIEGGEYNAFLGMDNLMKSNIVNTVIFELNKGMLQSDWEPFTDMILNWGIIGKKFYGLSDEGDLTAIEIRDLLKRESYPYVIMKQV
ncbi:FkbM family methyltransferase [Paenibacillus polymyxa]|uniref:FkbM family methyltransferase n=1 Tax=Paenibacillus polymyxa TaxID=1406 RepID=UPI000495EFB4|nr:FkbM family methyltransferase [Paenibacillus polymyxa]MBY7738396.1 FkbM family methyltransferase [Paenibacillus polymyxa]MEE4578263.1 FkbM family methyltransferase [Paenibacillus polymyxa]NMP12161.1 FkbM family methyltransferase [Paenibacillus polymyxa]UQQ34911.1 FkbM family methyltransferase [Paenibacillus polymyxa]